eukprot:6526590-Pyramimonas_sp.AAC.1
MNKDDHERGPESPGTCHVQCELLRRRGAASSEYVGLPWPAPHYKPRHADDGPCTVSSRRASIRDGG